jgi:DNA repair protein SbcD/Mre11
MRILHTADWHLGKRLERFERLEEQRAVLDEICAIADREEVDAIIVAGDLFDTFNPPTDAVELFYMRLRQLTKGGQRPVIAIAGNHDSPDRIEAPDPLARACGIFFAGYPQSHPQPLSLETGLQVLRTDAGFLELQLPGYSTPLRLLLVPYVNEHRLGRGLDPRNPAEALRTVLREQWATLAEQYCDPHGVNIMAAHLLMMQAGDAVPEESEDEKSVLIGGAGAVFTDMVPPQIQYVALGHLHRLQNMGGGPCPCVYASSPLAYSFGEAGQQKYVVVVDLEPGGPVAWRGIPLQSGFGLVRMTFESADEALVWLEDHPDVYVELSLVTETYIVSEDRRRLLAAHPRLIGPIPKFKSDFEPMQGRALVDPKAGLEDLFVQYFQHVKGVAPEERILSLFKEVVHAEVEP